MIRRDVGDDPDTTGGDQVGDGNTLAEKVWERHVVRRAAGEPDLLYIDLHLVHEVTSPQAFDGLRMAARTVRRPDLTLATMDHNVPTTDLTRPIEDPVSAKQMEVLAANCSEFGIRLYPMGHDRQGIVHIIGPELGLTQPGMTIVCGDSHTSTHGAFGALAFGIGTSEVEHVLATQTLPQPRPLTMAVNVDGDLPEGVSPKDLILAIIGEIGTGGGMGHVIEYRGKGHRLAVDGGEDDGLQHVHRGRRPSRDDRSRRHHLRLSRRTPRRPSRKCLAGRAGGLAITRNRRGGDLRQGGDHRRVGTDPVRVLGHQPLASRADRGQHPCCRLILGGLGPGVRRAGAGVHGPRGGYPRQGCEGGHGVHRLLHERPHRGSPGRRARSWAPGRSLRVSVPWWFRGPLR